MDDRAARESELFVRYEARIVALEIESSEAREWRKKYGAIVDELLVTDAIAKEVARRLLESGRMGLTRVQLVVSIVAIVLGPVLAVLAARFFGAG